MMRKTRIYFLAAVVLFFSAGSARAGDFATLNFIGFSKDGRYLAFEEYGVGDGSGFPYSSIYFVDVDKNIFAAKSVNVRIENESATEKLARSRARLGANASMRKLGIVERNVGALVVSRLLTDVAVNNFLIDEPDKTQTVNFAEVIGSMYRSGDYDLILRPIEIKTEASCAYADRPIFKFEMSLKDKTNDRTTILAKDGALPTSRSCPIDYAIQSVYLYENSIAVFLNTYHIGFEGPDMRYLVVTGKYK
jgi:predicted secreted protein